MGPRGCETKIALDDSSGLRAHFSNKTFVKKVLALNFKSQAEKMLAYDTIAKDLQKPEDN